MFHPKNRQLSGSIFKFKLKILNGKRSFSFRISSKCTCSRNERNILMFITFIRMFLFPCYQSARIEHKMRRNVLVLILRETIFDTILCTGKIKENRKIYIEQKCNFERWKLFFLISSFIHFCPWCSTCGWIFHSYFINFSILQHLSFYLFFMYYFMTKFTVRWLTVEF